AVGVAVGQLGPLQAGAVGGGGHIPAEAGLQIAGQVAAVLLGGLAHGLDRLVNGGLVLLGHGVAGLVGSVEQGGLAGQGGHGLIQEVVVVGLGLGLIPVLLGGIHAGVKAGRAVQAVLILRLHGAVVVVHHIGDAVVPAAHADGRLPALEDAGVPHQQDHHQDG